MIFHVLAEHENVYDHLFANATWCDTLCNAMTYHIFQLWLQIYHFKFHIPFDVKPVKHHSNKQGLKPLLPFQHLSSLPHHRAACMGNKPWPAFFETWKSVRFDKICCLYLWDMFLVICEHEISLVRATLTTTKSTKWATVTRFLHWGQY